MKISVWFRHAVVFGGMIFMLSLGVYWCLINRPFRERIQFPYTKYKPFPLLTKSIPISMCPSVHATTEYAFVGLLSTLLEKRCFLDCFERYVKGAIVLARSIRRVTNLNMILMVVGEARDHMSSETRLVLVKEGWMICAMPDIESPKSSPSDNRFILGLLYSKLNVWRLVEYKAVMILDLDMMVMRDPTDIFTSVLPKMLAENKTLGAVIDRPGPGGIGGKMCNEQWKDVPLFNAGSLLVVPSVSTYQWLIQNLYTIKHDYSLAEQAYLNAIYNSSFYVLPFTYNGNMRSILCEPHVWANGNVQILHFNVEKPWGFARFDLTDPYGLIPYMLLWQSVLDTPARHHL